MSYSELLKLIAKIVLMLFALCGIAVGVVALVWVKGNGGGVLTVPLTVAVFLGSVYLIYYAIIL